MLRNIGLTTIPVCIVIYFIIFYLFQSSLLAFFISAILLVLSISSNVRKYRSDIKIETAGFHKNLYKAQNAFHLVAPNDSVSPSLCLEIANDKYLLLNGQWLYESDLYGGEAGDFYDSESEIFNCHTHTFSFPATVFELWVSKLDGTPQKIVVKGEYIEPKVVSWKTPEKHCNKMFALINRSEIKKEKTE